MPEVNSGPIINGMSANNAVGSGFSYSVSRYVGILWDAQGHIVTLLEVPGSTFPEVSGVSGNTQVGHADINETTHAVLWHGTTESWIDLNPGEASWSSADAADVDIQTGTAQFGDSEHAGLWRGTAESWVDLNPQGWDNSNASTASAGWQGGYAYNNGGSSVAAVWNSTADSFVNMHPTPLATYSEITGLSYGQACGEAYFGEYPHALYWPAFSPDSYIDLQSALPSDYIASRARGIWTDGAGKTYIVGYAQRGEPDYEQVAVMWTYGDNGCGAPIGSTDASLDCDGDMILDSCQTPAAADDCNQNGISDACETLDFTNESFDANSSGAFTVNGSAFISDGRAILTPTDFGQMGSIVRPPLTASPLSRARAIFDFRISDTGSYPADGFSFSLMDANVYDVNTVFGEDGPGPSALTVKFNTFDNGGETSNSIDIRYNGNLISHETFLPFDLVDSEWHRAVIDLSPGGALTVKVGTRPGDIQAIFNSVVIPDFNPFVALIGFGGRTGAGDNTHAVDNIRLGIPNLADRDHDGVPNVCQCLADFNLDGGVDGADVGAFFAAWENGDAAADVNFDGGIDGADVDTFFFRWESGC